MINLSWLKTYHVWFNSLHFYLGSIFNRNRYKDLFLRNWRNFFLKGSIEVYMTILSSLKKCYYLISWNTGKPILKILANIKNYNPTFIFDCNQEKEKEKKGEQIRNAKLEKYEVKFVFFKVIHGWREKIKTKIKGKKQLKILKDRSKNG